MNTRYLKKRLHYIKGQIEGIERMLDADRDPNDIYRLRHNLWEKGIGLFSKT